MRDDLSLPEVSLRFDGGVWALRVVLGFGDAMRVWQVALTREALEVLGLSEAVALASRSAPADLGDVAAAFARELARFSGPAPG